MAEPIISVSGVKKFFGSTKAVDGIDLTIEKGEFVALLGPNGAGKTTLVEMIEGIQKPDKGEILINNLPWKGNESKLRKIIGISFQETYFIEKLTVWETLELFSGFYDLPRERSEAIIELVGLSEKRKTYTKHLSGGQRQKLALGIAFLNQPEVLLLDEPTTGLDPTARREIWEILKKLRKAYNTAMILTTHYMEEASYLCERIVIIDRGRVLARGTLDDLLSEYINGEKISFAVNRQLSNNGIPKPDSIINMNFSEDGLKGEIIVKDLVDYLPTFLQYIEEEKLSLTSLECRKMTLDDLFIAMTGRHLIEEK
ncbi:MAG: ABC transporter ATP-binding protein [Cyclobacteriaceae bacterium]